MDYTCSLPTWEPLQQKRLIADTAAAREMEVHL